MEAEVEQPKVQSAPVMFATMRREEKRGSEVREHVFFSPFSCYHCTFSSRQSQVTRSKWAAWLFPGFSTVEHTTLRKMINSD